MLCHSKPDSHRCLRSSQWGSEFHTRMSHRLRDLFQYIISTAHGIMRATSRAYSIFILGSTKEQASTLLTIPPVLLFKIGLVRHT